MPVYDYKCTECNGAFSVLVAEKARDQVRCPNCGGHNLKSMSAVTAKEQTKKLVVHCG